MVTKKETGFQEQLGPAELASLLVANKKTANWLARELKVPARRVKSWVFNGFIPLKATPEILKAFRKLNESKTAPSQSRKSYYLVKTKDGGELECFDVIEALGFGFHLGNVLKYLWRAGRKSPSRLEDLQKARVYLDREISSMTGGSRG